jgi:hypothetical protein
MPAPFFEPPSAENGFHEAHALLMLRCLKELSGIDVLAEEKLTGADLGKKIFFGDFFLLSHQGGEGARLNYANAFVLDAWELGWEQMSGMPSSHTAREDRREAREELMRQVREKGYITNYSGIRMSRTGKEFWIREGVVWNLRDTSGGPYGQAAYFRRIEMIA